MSDCIFCKIVRKEIGDLIYEDELFVAFVDLVPKAKVHLLIVPKKHIESVDTLTESDAEWLGKIFLVAKELAKKYKLDNGYKLIMNTGPDSGQTVKHLHLHLLGGEKLSLSV